MIKTVRDLIDELEQYDDDTPVYLAEQPSYPFRYSIAGTTITDLNRNGEEDDDEEVTETPTPKPPRVKKEAVLLLEGSQIAYGKRDWWNSW